MSFRPKSPFLLSQESTGPKRRNLLKNVIARIKYLRAYKAPRQSHLLSFRAQRGNLTKDERGYEYEYDYENRIVKITKNSQTKAEFAYDALGRRIQKKDLIDPNNTTRYYYNYNWQVLAEYDGAGSYKKLFIYGNYIDEVLYTQGTNPGTRRYYVHDHLYSPIALVYATGTVLERYEYDAYGKPTIWNADFTTERNSSNYGNPYLFTGRRVDILDSSSLKIQYNRNRYYDYYTGRWLTHDPLGYYSDGMNLYEYVNSNPVRFLDMFGTCASNCTHCEYRHIKICSVGDEALEKAAGLFGGALNISSTPFELGVGALTGIAQASGMVIGAMAGQIAGALLSEFPGLSGTVVPNIRGHKVEHFSLIQVPCGDDCTWDISAATTTFKHEKYRTDWFEGDLVATTFLTREIKKIILRHANELRLFFYPSNYCHYNSFTCKKGDKVTDTDVLPPSEPEEQLCEEFEWKTKD